MVDSDSCDKQLLEACLRAASSQSSSATDGGKRREFQALRFKVPIPCYDLTSYAIYLHSYTSELFSILWGSLLVTLDNATIHDGYALCCA